MISKFRHPSYAAGLIVLFLCLTVSIRAQEAADRSNDRTGDTKQTDGKSGTAALSTSASKDVITDSVKDSSDSESASTPVSFLAPPLPKKSERLDTLPSASAAQGSSDEWRFMVAPYLWLAGVSGTVGVGDLTTDVDPSASDILNALNFGFMGTFEAGKNRFTIITDLMYISLEESRQLNGLFNDITVNQKVFMLSPVVGYRLVEKDGGFLDAIAGVRFWHMSTKIETSSGILPGRTAEQSKNWADVIGGLRGQAHVTKIFSVIGRADLGGGGSDFTYQLFGGVGIDVTEAISLFAGYRYMHIKYTRDDFLFDGALKGAVLGAAFRF